MSISLADFVSKSSGAVPLKGILKNSRSTIEESLGVVKDIQNTIRWASRPVHFWEVDEDSDSDPLGWWSHHFETDYNDEPPLQGFTANVPQLMDLSELRRTLNKAGSIPTPWKQLLQDILRRLDEFEKGLPSDIVKASQTLD